MILNNMNKRDDIKIMTAAKTLDRNRKCKQSLVFDIRIVFDDHYLNRICQRLAAGFVFDFNQIPATVPIQTSSLPLSDTKHQYPTVHTTQFWVLVK